MKEFTPGPIPFVFSSVERRYKPIDVSSFAPVTGYLHDDQLTCYELLTQTDPNLAITGFYQSSRCFKVSFFNWRGSTVSNTTAAAISPEFNENRGYFTGEWSSSSKTTSVEMIGISCRVPRRSCERKFLEFFRTLPRFLSIIYFGSTRAM